MFSVIIQSINLTKNLIQHSRTKHIEARHLFIWELVKAGSIELIYVPTEKQLTNIFTKLLCEESFCKIRLELGLILT